MTGSHLACLLNYYLVQEKLQRKQKLFLHKKAKHMKNKHDDMRAIIQTCWIKCVNVDFYPACKAFCDNYISVNNGCLCKENFKT